MFDDDFLYDCSPAGLAFRELLEEDLTPTSEVAEPQPTQSTGDTATAVSSKPNKRFQPCQLHVTEHPFSFRINDDGSITQLPQANGILADIDQAIQESLIVHEEDNDYAEEEKEAVPIGPQYVEITDDHRALAEELQKYTCPPLELLDKGANAFLTLVTGVQYGEPYRRRPRKVVETTSEDDEEQEESVPRRVLLFSSDGEDSRSPVKEQRITEFASASDKETTGSAGPFREKGCSSSMKKKRLNLLFPNPSKEDSPFVKRMKNIQTNGPRFGENVVYMEQLEAMNERIEALERQLKLTPFVSPIETPSKVKAPRSSASSKSDDFEVVDQSEKLSAEQLEAALAEANERIAEAERRRDEMADQYNKLVQSMMETVMNSAK